MVAEDHPLSLGAFNMTPEAMALYQRCDLMVVIGSRLRGNETHNNRMPLPEQLVQIDVDASQCGRNYPLAQMVQGAAADTLARVLAQLPEQLDTDPALAAEIAGAREAGAARLMEQLGPYAALARALDARVAAGGTPGCGM